jgi:ubiquinone/menaquinone biosynthesis C-methylase UbiE
VTLPPEPDRWLESCPDHLRPALRQCVSADVPANIALMQLLIAAASPEEVDAVLAAADRQITSRRPHGQTNRLGQVLALWRDNPQAFAVVKSVLGDVQHSAHSLTVDDGVAYWTAAFDRMVRASPEGSVALYTFGNPELLRQATSEVVDRLGQWGLLGEDKAVLDIGCGIGRFVEALAPRTQHVTGVDISAVMLERARERCAHLANVTLLLISGRDLAPLSDGSFDLVLAADVFPYLVEAGGSLVERYIRETTRVLRPGGHLVVLNFSYRGDVEQDRADLQSFAAPCHLMLTHVGRQEFGLWDATTFHLIRNS